MGVRGPLLTAVMAGLLGALVNDAAVAASPTALLVPQADAFSVLGHSCGGIQERAFATGFDPSSGFPIGDVYLSTSCGGSGRGGGYHTTTYSAWVQATWDLTGALVTYTVLSTVPTVDPAFSVLDAYGNQLYNQSNSAFLLLAPGFVPAPRFLSVSPTLGPASGGTTVTIVGTGLTAATAVSFGQTGAASFVVNSDTSITAVSPVAGGGTVDVTVTTAGGTSSLTPSDQFDFIPLPVVSGISPGSGPVSGGTTVEITGTNFSDATAVNFGDTPAAYVVNDDSSITAQAPPAETADTVDITVETVGGTSLPTGADQFTYAPAGCGLLGLEPIVLLAGLRVARARRRRRTA